MILVPAAAADAADRRVPQAPAVTNTARHRRTNRRQNHTEKLPNVTSRTLLELRELRGLMRQTRRLLPLLLPLVLLLLLLPTEEYQKHLPAPKQQGTEGGMLLLVAAFYALLTLIS